MNVSRDIRFVINLSIQLLASFVACGEGNCQLIKSQGSLLFHGNYYLRRTNTRRLAKSTLEEIPFGISSTHIMSLMQETTLYQISQVQCITK